MNLAQFKDWAVGQGSVAKYNDAQFLGECVSLINQYCYRVLNVQAGAWGHAYAWANDTNENVKKYFDKVGSIQAGDIIVYGTNFTPTYGHIGIALGNGQLLDQNGRTPRKVAIGAIYNGYGAILRRKGGNVETFKDTNDVRVNGFNLFGIDIAGNDPALQTWVGKSKLEFFKGLGATVINNLKAKDKVIADLQAQTGEYIKVSDLYIKKGG